MNPYNAVTLGCVVGVLGFVIIVVVITSLATHIRKRKKSSPFIVGLIKSPNSTPITRSPSWSHVLEICSGSRSSGNSPISTPKPSLKLIMPQPPQKQPSIRPTKGSFKDKLRSKLSEAVAPPEPVGVLEYTLDVFDDKDFVTIKVIKVNGLEKSYLKDHPNIFVQLNVFPEKIVFQTKTIKKTKNPVYNEQFTCRASCDSLITFSVFNINIRNTCQSLGHAQIRIKEALKHKSSVQLLDLEKSVMSLAPQTGELEISLMFSMDPSGLDVTIISCRDLPVRQDATTSQDYELFIRLQLMIGRKIYKCKETKAQKALVNPVFQENLKFPIPGKHFEMAHLICQLIQRSGSKSENHDVYCEEVIGYLHFGTNLYARGDQKVHWLKVIEQPKETICMTHVWDLPLSE